MMQLRMAFAGLLLGASLMSACGGGSSAAPTAGTATPSPPAAAPSSPPASPPMPSASPSPARVQIGLVWMLLGDSQTSGRATGEVTSHVTAFRAIWDRSFPNAANPSAYVNGESGRRLQATADHYASRAERHDRTWVHFQESGGQDGGGQSTAAEFGATWEAFVRRIHAESPNAVISTETAFSFGREATAGRNWDPYNVVLREKAALLAQQGIKVVVADVDRNIKALGALIGAQNVWFQSNEPNPYHYKGVGNLMVALTIFHALGYNVNALDLSGITSVPADWKAKCIEVINKS